MNTSLPFITLFLFLLVIGAIFANQHLDGQLAEQTISPEPPLKPPIPTSGDCVPTFVDGGGPYYKENAPFRSTIAPANSEGERLIVTGKVLKQDCQTPLAGAILDIWQANATGNYEDEWYRGKVSTDSQGNYAFETVVPKGYGEGTGYRPPHIHFKVFLKGQEVITSQMFLPAAQEQQIEEAYIIQVKTKEENNHTVHFGHHDIVVNL